MQQINREILHENVAALKEVILEDKSIYMVFEYAEHDFLVRPPVRSNSTRLAHEIPYSNLFTTTLRPYARRYLLQCSSRSHTNF